MSKRLFIMILLLIIIPLFSCIKEPNNYSGMVFYFDTTIDIRLNSYDYNKEELENKYNDIVNILANFSMLTDNYQEYKNINNIYTINNSKDYVTVSEELIDIIKLSIDIKEETNGYFNPFLGKISKIYKKIIDEEKVPDNLDELIQNELNNLNNSSIDIVDNSVKINGDMELDLGGIAKGYALSIIKDYLDESSISDYLINAGSSSIIMGTKYKDKGYYKVASKYDSERIFKIKNNCLGTSSIFEQSITINGKLYHHIINPLTGKIENNYDTIYIIGSNACYIDSYTTALFNMTIEEITSFIKDKDLSIFIYKDNKLIYNNNNGDYYG